jgi:hypothetical protein
MTPFRSVDHAAPDSACTVHLERRNKIDLRACFTRSKADSSVFNIGGAEGVRTPDPHTASPERTAYSTCDSTVLPRQTACNQSSSVQYNAVRRQFNTHPCSRLLQHVPV